MIHRGLKIHFHFIFGKKSISIKYLICMIRRGLKIHFYFFFGKKSVGRDEREREREIRSENRIYSLKGNEFAFIQFNSNGRWTERRRDVFCSRIILSQPRASLEIQISPFGWMMRRGSGRRGGEGGGHENVSECVKLIMHSSCFRRRRR